GGGGNAAIAKKKLVEAAEIVTGAAFVLRSRWSDSSNNNYDKAAGAVPDFVSNAVAAGRETNAWVKALQLLQRPAIAH
ncbi:hypothetical protein Ancab_022163, partial [Ancistrocladus abbreviatus]